MGAILAVFDRQMPQDAIRHAIQPMLDRSPYRGEPQTMVEDGMAFAAQIRRDDASIATHQNLFVACHGFIGNWQDLTSTYGSDGVEVNDAGRIARLYLEQGDSLFARLRGEFAIIVYDRDKQIVLAVRDVIGTRPLFYRQDGGRLWLASEIRQIRAGACLQPEIERAVVSGFLLGCPTQQHLTLDRNVFRIEPGQLWTLSIGCLNRTPQLRPYWIPPPTNQARHYDIDALTEEFRVILERVVARYIPDMPFAVALSGGLDSSSIWALVSRELSSRQQSGLALPISQRFQGLSCDEGELIKKVRDFTAARDFVEFDYSEENDPLRLFGELLTLSDGCVNMTADSAIKLARQSRTHGREILLTGVGEEWIGGRFRFLADEILSGDWWQVVSCFRKAQPYRLLGVSRLRPLIGESGLHRLLRPRIFKAAARQTLNPEILKIKREDMPTPPAIQDRHGASRWPRARLALINDLQFAQSGRIYETIEQIAASVGVEFRHPFNDLDFIEFAFRTPPQAFTHRFRQKELLRRALHDLLPGELLDLTVKVSHYQRSAPFIRQCQEEGEYKRWALVREGFLDGDVLEQQMLHLTQDFQAGSLSIERQAQMAWIALFYCTEKLLSQYA